MQLETVKYEKREGIIIISLNRPEVLNAVNQQLASDLLAALRSAEADTEAKVIILKGEGRAFSAGLDLSEQPSARPAPIEDRHDTMTSVTNIIASTRKTIIAAVHGYAIGYGLQLARSARLRIVAEGTRFDSKFPGELLDTEEALEYGIANKVVPLEELDETVMDIARKIIALETGRS